MKEEIKTNKKCVRPTSKELKNKIWYRVLKVISVLILVGASISPWITQDPSPFLFIDSAINVSIWLVLILVIRAVILYILYGKKEMTPEEKKRIWEWIIWGGATVILIGSFLSAVIYWLING